MVIPDLQHSVYPTVGGDEPVAGKVFSHLRGANDASYKEEESGEDDDDFADRVQNDLRGGGAV